MVDIYEIYAEMKINKQIKDPFLYLSLHLTKSWFE
jgi:hypothetical protein